MTKYWKEVLFFSSIFVYYLFGLTTDMTWMSLGGDMFSYVGSAEYMQPAILAGYPVWVMIAWVFMRLPFNPFWSGALLSALCSVGAAIFIFLTVKHLTGKKLPAYLAALIYSGAFITWTQSIIPEVYTPTLLIMVAGTYFVVRQKFYWSTFTFAIGLGLHPIVFFAIIPCMIFTYYVKRDWKFVARLLIFGSLGFLSFLQMELAPSAVGNDVVSSGDTTWKVLQTVGALPLIPFESTATRWLEFLIIYSVSFLFAVPLLFLVPRNKETILLASIGLSVFALYMLSLLPMWVTYNTFVVAFLCILAGYGASRVTDRRLLIPYFLIPIVLMGWNYTNFDIGRTVDPTPTTARQFYELLDDVPQGSILVTSSWAHPGLLTEYKNLKEDTEISLMRYAKVFWEDRDGQYKDYIERLREKGIDVPAPTEIDERPQMNEYFEEWVHLVAEKNPDREVYVAYLDKLEPEVHFGLVSAASYYNGINVCWRGSH